MTIFNVFFYNKSNVCGMEGGGATLSFINLFTDFFFFLPGPMNPIRMQPLSSLISAQKLMVSQLVSCLSDNKGLEYQPVCYNEGGPGVFT